MARTTAECAKSQPSLRGGFETSYMSSRGSGVRGSGASLYKTPLSGETLLNALQSAINTLSVKILLHDAFLNRSFYGD